MINIYDEAINGKSKKQNAAQSQGTFTFEKNPNSTLHVDFSYLASLFNQIFYKMY